jgi:cytoskeletal protein RodZ
MKKKTLFVSVVLAACLALAGLSACSSNESTSGSSSSSSDKTQLDVKEKTQSQTDSSSSSSESSSSSSSSSSSDSGSSSSSSSSTTDETSVENVIVGGWNVAGNYAALAIPEDDLAAFESATAGYMGASFEPIALLGTQIVSGTNYAFLCVQTVSAADDPYSLVVVTIYEDLHGNSEVLNIAPVEIGIS